MVQTYPNGKIYIYQIYRGAVKDFQINLRIFQINHYYDNQRLENEMRVFEVLIIDQTFSHGTRMEVYLHIHVWFNSLGVTLSPVRAKGYLNCSTPQDKSPHCHTRLLDEYLSNMTKLACGTG